MKRLQVASWYNYHLPGFVKRPYPSKTWHLYTIKSAKRDALYEKLAENGITAGVHYKPLYKYTKVFGEQPELPNTEAAYKTIISLPMHLEMTEEDVKNICRLI